jgi:plasmid stabilization system protein ParE
MPREDLLPSLCSFQVNPYLIYYRRDDNRVTILRILHGSRNVESHFRDDTNDID